MRKALFCILILIPSMFAFKPGPAPGFVQLKTKNMDIKVISVSGIAKQNGNTFICEEHIRFVLPENQKLKDNTNQLKGSNFSISIIDEAEENDEPIFSPETLMILDHGSSSMSFHISGAKYEIIDNYKLIIKAFSDTVVVSIYSEINPEFVYSGPPAPLKKKNRFDLYSPFEYSGNERLLECENVIFTLITDSKDDFKTKFAIEPIQSTEGTLHYYIWTNEEVLRTNNRIESKQ